MTLRTPSDRRRKAGLISSMSKYRKEIRLSGNTAFLVDIQRSFSSSSTNADVVAKVLGIAPSSSYELMHEVDFPVLKVGSRMVVPKEKFIQWVEDHTQGGTQ